MIIQDAIVAKPILHTSMTLWHFLSSSCLVKLPCFLNQHALLNSSPFRLVRNLVRDVRHDFSMNLPGARAWLATALALRLPVEKTVLLAGRINSAYGRRRCILVARSEAGKVDLEWLAHFSFPARRS